MDYSQILASQLVNKDSWIENEDAFYDMLSLDGLAKLKSTVRRVGASVMRLVDVTFRASQKQVRHT